MIEYFCLYIFKVVCCRCLICGFIMLGTIRTCVDKTVHYTCGSSSSNEIRKHCRTNRIIVPSQIYQLPFPNFKAINITLRYFQSKQFFKKTLSDLFALLLLMCIKTSSLILPFFLIHLSITWTYLNS